MADSTIANLPDGGIIQAGDVFPIERGGSTLKVGWAAGGPLLFNTIKPSPSDLHALGFLDLVNGVPNKIIIPISVAIQCDGTSGNRYSTTGNFPIQLFDGTQIGGIDSGVLAQSGTYNFTQTMLSINTLSTLDQSIGNPLEISTNGQNLTGGSPNTPLTVGVAGTGYAPGDTGTWGAFNAFTYTVLTVNGGGGVVTYSTNTSGNDWTFAGNQPTSVSTGGGDGAFKIHVPSVNAGTAPVAITTAYYLVDATI